MPHGSRQNGVQSSEKKRLINTGKREISDIAEPLINSPEIKENNEVVN